jgi:hypothetical protein
MVEGLDLVSPAGRRSTRRSSSRLREYLAGHANAATTQLYDRRRVTRNIVERVSI